MDQFTFYDLYYEFYYPYFTLTPSKNYQNSENNDIK